MKKLFAMLTLTLIALTGCGGGGGDGDVPVVSVVLSSISVTPANNNLPIGTTQQYTATGNYSDGSTQNLTSSVAWSSSSPSIATIDTSGKATMVAAGTTTIRASSGSISGSTALEVSDLGVPPGVGSTADVQGTWIGTYKITEYSDNPGSVGQQYNYKFELVQNGSSVTGTATLRGGTAEQATSFQFAGTVTGNRLDFSFSYIAPWDASKRVNEDIGAGTITGTSMTEMTGASLENFNDGFGGRYTFSLVKQP